MFSRHLKFMSKAFRSYYQTILHYITYFCGSVSMAQAEFILRKRMIYEYYLHRIPELLPHDAGDFCAKTLTIKPLLQGATRSMGPEMEAILLFLFLLFSLPTPAGGEKTRATSIWLSPLFVRRVLWVNVVRLWRQGSGGASGGGGGGGGGGGFFNYLWWGRTVHHH